MGYFAHRRAARAQRRDAEPSLCDEEENPELLAAERAVNQLPPPPPSSNPYWDAVRGAPPQLVSFPEEETPAPS